MVRPGSPAKGLALPLSRPDILREEKEWVLLLEKEGMPAEWAKPADVHSDSFQALPPQHTHMLHHSHIKHPFPQVWGSSFLLLGILPYLVIHTFERVASCFSLHLIIIHSFLSLVQSGFFPHHSTEVSITESAMASSHRFALSFLISLFYLVL